MLKLQEHSTLKDLLSLTKTEQILKLAELNAELEQLNAEQRVRWAFENLPGQHILSSSFGMQLRLCFIWLVRFVQKPR